MTYGQRLTAAREYAGLSQAALATRVGLTQANISKLETREEGDGSKYTAQLARACGVDAYWLATGEGEMVEKFSTALDGRIRHVIGVMEHLPEYAIDQAVKGVDSIADIVSKASRDARGD